MALVFPYVRTHEPTELLFPPLGLAALAAQLHAHGIEARVFDCTFSSHERPARRARRLRPRRGRHLLDGQPHRRDAARGRAGASGAAGGAAGGRRTAAHGVPRALRRPRGRGVPRGGRPELPRVLPRLPRARRPRRTLLDLDLTDYDGVFVARRRPRRGHARRALRRGRPAHVPRPRPQRLRPRRVPGRVAATRPASRPTSLVVTLGCPYACDFCSKPVFGNEVRRRDLRHGDGGGRRPARPGLRRPLDRRRHLHARRRPPGRVLPAHRSARHDLELPLARRPGHARDGRADARGRVPHRAPGPGVRQPADARAHEQAHDAWRTARARRGPTTRPASRSGPSSWSGTPARRTTTSR